jgi:hypothetical protein
LAGVSVALIVVAFDWHVTSRPSIPAFLAAQLGAGLLVGAVGAALVQGFIMSAPQTWRKLVDELRSDTREASQHEVAGRLAALNDLTGEGIRAMEARLSGLVADLDAHDRRSRRAADEALSRAGVVNFYPARDEAMADVKAVLGDPRVPREWLALPGGLIRPVVSVPGNDGVLSSPPAATYPPQQPGRPRAPSPSTSRSRAGDCRRCSSILGDQ